VVYDAAAVGIFIVDSDFHQKVNPALSSG
jgi:hypothetical protein